MALGLEQRSNYGWSFVLVGLGYAGLSHGKHEGSALNG
jgi:hypothetical protein